MINLLSTWCHSSSTRSARAHEPSGGQPLLPTKSRSVFAGAAQQGVRPNLRSTMRIPKRWLQWSSATLAVVGCAASSAPPPTTLTSGLSGRSCDRLPLIQADTSLDSLDPLIRSLVPPGYRGPRFPRDMRDAGISGKVVASFVIDTSGRVPAGGAWIHSETDRSFGNAVCADLKSTQFIPPLVGGRRLSVRVVNHPTSFDIR